MKATTGILLAALMTAAAGCSSTMKASELTETGRFDTKSTVAPQDLKITAPFDREKYGKMAVVFPFTESKTVNDFFYQSINNAKVFETVMNKDEVERYVVQKNIEGVTDASSILSMRKLADTTGPFLVIKPYVEWKGGYDYIASLEATDANTAQVLFRAEKKAFNWAGLDGPLLRPLLNAFLDWTQGVAPPAQPAGTAKPAS